MRILSLRFERILIVHHWIELLLVSHHILRYSTKCIKLTWLLLLWRLSILVYIDGHVHPSKHICLLTTVSHWLIPLRHHTHKSIGSCLSLPLLLHLIVTTVKPSKRIEHLLRLLLLLLLVVLLLIVLCREFIECGILITLS